MHQHDEHCDCATSLNSRRAGEHHHGHDHHHAHDEHCGCGHEHHEIPAPEGLTEAQTDILLALCQRQCLPVACFSLARSSDDAYAIALAPVYLNAPDDSIEQVKWLGAELAQLEEMDLITLDYDIRVKGYAYEEYQASLVYRYFVKTVEEAAAMPDHVFDTPVLELGSMALTEAGQRMVEELLA